LVSFHLQWAMIHSSWCMQEDLVWSMEFVMNVQRAWYIPW